MWTKTQHHTQGKMFEENTPTLFDQHTESTRTSNEQLAEFSIAKAQKYQEKGAETIILGCTEIGVMLKGQNIKTANSIDILVDATIKKVLEMKKT